MFDIFNMLKKEEKEDDLMPKITRETIIGDILDMDQTTAPYFIEIGMHCLGCPASRGETLEEACEVHGVDCDELLDKLNAHIAGKPNA
jgi:hybrid cluster-associated redox disulfide protein